jgi:hypothetical protein
MPTKAFAGFNPAPGDSGLNTPLFKRTVTAWIIIALVGMEFGWSSTWAAARLENIGYGVHHRLKHFGIVDIGGGVPNDKRNAVRINHQVAFRARFAPIGRIRASIWATCGGRNAP